jgi:hypothetical protein
MNAIEFKAAIKQAEEIRVYVAMFDNDDGEYVKVSKAAMLDKQWRMSHNVSVRAGFGREQWNSQTLYINPQLTTA